MVTARRAYNARGVQTQMCDSSGVMTSLHLGDLAGGGGGWRGEEEGEREERGKREPEDVGRNETELVSENSLRKLEEKERENESV